MELNNKIMHVCVIELLCVCCMVQMTERFCETLENTRHLYHQIELFILSDLLKIKDHIQDGFDTVILSTVGCIKGATFLCEFTSTFLRSAVFTHPPN